MMRIKDLIICGALLLGGAVGFPIETAVAGELQTLPAIDENGDEVAGPVAAYAEARSILFDQPARALLLLESARSAAGSQEIPQVEWDLFYAYASFRANGEKFRDEKRLMLAVSAYDKAASPESYELGRILTDYAKLQLAEGNLKRARKTAARAEKILLITQPEDVRARSKAIIWGGVASLLEEPQFTSLIRAAYREFGRARALLLIEQVATGFDSAFLEAVAWQAAAAGAMATRSNFTRDLESLDAPFVMPLADTDGAALACTLGWEAKSASGVKSKVAWAPNLISYKAPSGLVIAVDISVDGTPINMRLLAEALPPDVDKRTRRQLKTRDKAILQALHRWRAQLHGSETARCLRDQILVFGGYERSSRAEFERNLRRMMRGR